MESPISTRAAILQVLASESCYGSAIMERVHLATESMLELHSGSVYPALTSLEDEGLIRRRKVVGSTNGHGRACFYELTRKGRQVAGEHRQIVEAVFFKVLEASDVRET